MKPTTIVPSKPFLILCHAPIDFISRSTNPISFGIISSIFRHFTLIVDKVHVIKQLISQLFVHIPSISSGYDGNGGEPAGILICP